MLKGQRCEVHMTLATPSIKGRYAPGNYFIPINCVNWFCKKVGPISSCLGNRTINAYEVFTTLKYFPLKPYSIAGFKLRTFCPWGGCDAASCQGRILSSWGGIQTDDLLCLRRCATALRRLNLAWYVCVSILILIHRNILLNVWHIIAELDAYSSSNIEVGRLISDILLSVLLAIISCKNY
jgi:hypothetical protein